jgi:RNA polymerase sigma factor (sigma-70 family)
MADERTFAELIARIQNGDQEAAGLFVQRYWPQVQRVVRLGLTDRRLRQRLDSLDVCQSVFGDFFLDMALGKYQPDSPTQLIQLLRTIAQNRVVDYGRKHRAARRDIRRTESPLMGENCGAASNDTPSQIVSRREILDQVEKRLGSKERWLMEQRLGGRTWEEIAKEMGSTAGAIRKRYDRAIRRIHQELAQTNG